MRATLAFQAAALWCVASSHELHGHGCEKALDKACPQWRSQDERTCHQCVRAHASALPKSCSVSKALAKCGSSPSPSPSPTPPVPPPPLPPKPTPPSKSKPNIVVVLTDDQDIELGSMDAMSFTRELGKTGANFSNFFAHTPVCCPSRSELLTGRYFHNIRNGGFEPSGCMHVNTSTGTPTGNPITFADAATQGGYATGYFGKYLNEGGMQAICPQKDGESKEKLLVPQGWREFMGACPDTCYVNCNYNVNGRSTWFRNASYTQGSNYGTSVIGNASVDFATRAMAANWPFLLVVASHAPHGPATPAPWYASLYSTPDVIAPRTPAFNVSSEDKHWIVATQPSLTDEYVDKKIDSFYKNRMRSLRSVDDVVAGLYGAVESAGQLNRTYFIFTSDHGLHMGQYCLGPCKRQPYDTDLRIPMLLVGPGIAPSQVKSVSGIVDLAPTILDLATSKSGSLTLDGQSLVPLIKGPVGDTAAAEKSWRDTYLIEYSATSGVPKASDVKKHLKDASNNTFIGMRIINSTHDLAYFEFSDAMTDWNFEHVDFCELYDKRSDPHQLSNICSSSPPHLRADLHRELRKLYSCKGGDCP